MNKAHFSKHDNPQLEVRDSGRETRDSGLQMSQSKLFSEERLGTRDSGLQMSQSKLFSEERLGTRDSGPVTCLGMTFENNEARRSYFLEQLREKLKDPEFRKIEGFPIGDDEDILRLSDPPYYTACPNPFVEDFVKHWNQSRVQSSESKVNDGNSTQDSGLATRDSGPTTRDPGLGTILASRSPSM